MIERYSKPEMMAVWDLKFKYETWYEVELSALRAMVKLDLVPKEALVEIEGKTVDIDPDRIEEIEQVTKHDVIAFLTHIEEQIGEPARWIHYGMTSSDVLDTAFAIQIKKASKIIEQDLLNIMEVIKRRAFEHKNTPMIGRSHGIHAEPITFGLVLALWYAEMGRNLKRLKAAAKSMSVGMISGAVGTFANIPPEVEEMVCEELGLVPEPVSNQIIQRDRHAEFFSVLATIGATIEKITVQIRHQQRTEVREVEEAFSKGQKGSSAMPHKRNPIGSENLSGLARILRSNAMAAFENVALWHERDISHSSVERIIAPDSTMLVDYMLQRLTGMLDNLVVMPDNMMKNINLMRGLVFSQRILLDTVAKGVPRQKAYEIVQRNAMKVWNDENLTLEEALTSDTELLSYLDAESIKASFDLSIHFKHVDHIFKRVFD